MSPREEYNLLKEKWENLERWNYMGGRINPPRENILEQLRISRRLDELQPLIEQGFPPGIKNATQRTN